MYLSKIFKAYLTGFFLFAFMLSNPVLAASVKGTAPSGAELTIEIKKLPALKYPKRAERLGVEGYVVVAFDLSEKGDVVDLRVVEAEPRMVFDKSAMKFVKGMRFTVPEEDGEPVMARDIQFKVGFRLKDKFR
ncbi:MAG: TonB family protein [Luminiphilus sp.]|jgi:periplasmic protein TonB|nr:TonB family protein [Luminiphilus sp.]